MSVDPTDPDTFEDDESAPAADASEADAAEQHTQWQQTHDAPLTSIDPDTANEADAAEQARVITLDEDDYR